MSTTTAGRKKDDGYRLKKHAKIGSSVPIGDKTIAPGAAHITVIRPQMQKGPLWFRIAPTLNKDNPQELMPVCYPDDLALDDLTDWVRQMPAAKYMGCEGGDRVTCLLHAPNDESYDPWKVNPYYLLYRFAKKAFSNVKSKENALWEPKWNGLMPSPGNKEAGLKPPDALYAMLGYVYENGKDRYFKENGVPLGLGDNDGTILIQLPKSAGEAIVTGASEANPNYQQGLAEHDPNDPVAALAAYNDYFEKAHKNGDVVSLKTGRICCAHDPDLFPLDSLVPQKAAKIGIATNRGATGGGGKKNDFTHYEAFFKKSYFFQRREKFPVDLTEYEDKIKKRIQFLSELLYVPTHEELALWIAFAFKPVGKLLRLAWTDNPEFMTDDVRKVLGAAKTVAVNGTKKPKNKAETDVTAPPAADLADDDEVQGTPVTDDDDDDLPALPPDADEVDDDPVAGDDDATPPEALETEPEGDGEAADAEAAAAGDPEVSDDAEAGEPAADEPAADEAAAATAEGDADPEDDLTTDDDLTDDDGEALPDDEVVDDDDDDDAGGGEADDDAAAATEGDDTGEEAPLADPDADDDPTSQLPRSGGKAATKPASTEEEGPPVTVTRPASPKPGATAAKPAAKPAAAPAAKAPATKPATTAAKPAAAPSYYAPVAGKAPAAKPAAAPAAKPAAADPKAVAKAGANASAKARSANRTAK